MRIRQAIRLHNPPSLVTPGLARLLLRRLGRIEVVCNGHAWWPWPSHGAVLALDRFDADGRGPELRVGELVLVQAEGRQVELVRVLDPARGPGGRIEVAEDAVPGSRRRILAGEILARSGPRPRLERLKARCFPLSSRLAGLGALVRETREAVSAELGAESVLAKYDAQAADYGRMFQDPPSGVKRFLETALEKGGRLLVAGCGTGPDVAALAGMGFEVAGLDASIEMLRHARARPSLQTARLVASDIRWPGLASRRFSWIYMTPDVLNFIPRRSERIRALRALRELVVPGGGLLLGSRSFSGVRERMRCLLNYLVRRSCRRFVEWGDWYTTYVTADGRIQHSFIHIFSQRALRSEIEAAGWSGVRRTGDHVEAFNT